MAVTITLEPNGEASVRLLLTDNTTFNIDTDGANDGQQFLVLFQQDGTGGWTLSEGTGVKGTPQEGSVALDTTVVNYVFDQRIGTWVAQTNQGNQGITALTAAGAIPVKQGLVTLGGASAQAYTLASPVAGGPGVGDDGKILTISLATAHAHTVTTAADIINGTDDTITFAGAAGNSAQLRANAGVWWLIASTGVTLTEV